MSGPRIDQFSPDAHRARAGEPPLSATAWREQPARFASRAVGVGVSVLGVLMVDSVLRRVDLLAEGTPRPDRWTVDGGSPRW